ncbi:TrkA family potassium uptake protein [Janibacter cremeus]|uniref:potassium channel family protein n=1 Tax=Janibacter cremeus TaxID=1285192 RepID=UPI0023F972C2|nr:TrkA family potassium uptake protein [Janibacter cremeus]WEV78975.1 TrkA family potassium uptake protein [Janibacter cremeus]
MRVIIVGAGSVGTSIGQELLDNEHEVLFIDKATTEERMSRLPRAGWLAGDACEIATLQEAALQTGDVVVAATGDDKANLVVSLLAKTEFGIPRTVARVNNPKNEWMFDESWGVDVAVSTPRQMTALVEEAVSVGDLVRIFDFQQGSASMAGITLPPDNPNVGRRVGDIDFPQDTLLVGIIRDARPIGPGPDDALEAHDELLFLTTTEAEPHLEAMMRPGQPARHHGGE